MPNVPPTADLALKAFSENFDAVITSTPTALGLQASDATAYHGLTLDFGARLSTATDPATRTKGSIAAKSTSKLALLARTRQLAKIIYAHPGVTDQQLADLGLRVRDTTPTPVPAPSTRPLVSVDHDGTIRLADETSPTRRAKPAGVVGALIFTKLAPTAGDPAPLTPADASFSILATRTREALPIPPGNNGKTLWVLARWYNLRGDLGPVSAPVSVMIAA
jgi:hypothetical protein